MPDSRRERRPSASPKLVVGVTGGSGLIYALDLLQWLEAVPVETHLVVSAGAKQVIPTELDGGLAQLEALADVIHKDSDLGAAIASGSTLTLGMVVVPCSAGTLAKVAGGFGDTLVARAAHVTLKERRPLVLVVREAPYSRPMIQNMLAANDAGAVVMPASPGFYHRPASIVELVGSITARILDHLGIENDRSPRWQDASD
ncbi:MAG: UbiX family flavin prenyltransferase [Deinococcales bacterium]